MCMKATGIVRRVDDLGRIVIPKEIRRTLNILEGDPLEIFTTPEGDIVYRKYNEIKPSIDTIKGMLDSEDDPRVRKVLQQAIEDLEKINKENGTNER